MFKEPVLVFGANYDELKRTTKRAPITRSNVQPVHEWMVKCAHRTEELMAFERTSFAASD